MDIEGRFPEESSLPGTEIQSTGWDQIRRSAADATASKAVSIFVYRYVRGQPLCFGYSSSLPSDSDILLLVTSILSDVRGLNELPPLEGCTSLEVLRLDRANLSKIPDHICKTSPRLKSL